MNDLSKCPKCGGPADNGHDHCAPPTAYYCKICDGLDVISSTVATVQPEDAEDILGCLIELVDVVKKIAERGVKWERIKILVVQFAGIIVLGLAVWVA